VRLSNALSRAEGHCRFPEDAKLIKKPAYRLPTVNRTIATVRLAMSEQERIESHCPQYLRNVIRIITETGLRTDRGLTPIR